MFARLMSLDSCFNLKKGMRKRNRETLWYDELEEGSSPFYHHPGRVELVKNPFVIVYDKSTDTVVSVGWQAMCKWLRWAVKTPVIWFSQCCWHYSRSVLRFSSRLPHCVTSVRPDHNECLLILNTLPHGVNLHALPSQRTLSVFTPFYVSFHSWRRGAN